MDRLYVDVAAVTSVATVGRAIRQVGLAGKADTTAAASAIIVKLLISKKPTLRTLGLSAVV